MISSVLLEHYTYAIARERIILSDHMEKDLHIQLFMLINIYDVQHSFS